MIGLLIVCYLLDKIEVEEEKKRKINHAMPLPIYCNDRHGPRIGHQTSRSSKVCKSKDWRAVRPSSASQAGPHTTSKREPVCSFAAVLIACAALGRSYAMDSQPESACLQGRAELRRSDEVGRSQCQSAHYGKSRRFLISRPKSARGRCRCRRFLRRYSCQIL